VPGGRVFAGLPFARLQVVNGGIGRQCVFVRAQSYAVSVVRFQRQLFNLHIE